MTDEIESTTMTENLIKTFGATLQSAREAQGLERKDMAAQLRLNERFIVMMEEGTFSTDIPLMFMRGYLRAYSKLLHISEETVNEALETLKPQPLTAQTPEAALPRPSLTSGNYYMQIFTTLVVVTLVGLVGTWWYTHTTATNDESQSIPVASNQSTSIPLSTTEFIKPAAPTGTKLADATPAPSSNTPPTPPPSSTESSVQKLDANGGVDKHSLDSNSDVDRQGMDDDSTDDTATND